MQTIVHVVEDLNRGGAETLLTDLLPELNKYYKIVLVTLKPGNTFGDEMIKSCYGYYCLDYKGFRTFYSSIRKLKKIIRKYDPVLVRSQLTLSTIIARMACPKNIPFVFSIHSTISIQIKKDLKGRAIRLLERVTARKTDTLLGVSQVIIDDYRKSFSFYGKSYVLYNYVRDDFFSGFTTEIYKGGVLKLVAIGNLRHPKNYFYLVEAFKLLRNADVQLDIYGVGPLHDQLEEQISVNSAKITLKGGTANSFEALKGYHAFVMVSSFEGFGIAVAEAMAAGIPLILSDIEVFREITQGNAFFVDISSVESFTLLISKVMNGSCSLNSFIEINKQIAKERYSKTEYIRNLLKIYKDTLEGYEKKGNGKSV
jgi:glycosyltransferase involved in cell wall biosynthesis